MEKRLEELNKLRSYTEEVDNDLTMILQSLQWDRTHIFQHSKMVLCKYDSNHSILADKVDEHVQECLLRQNGYIKEDKFLPDPLSVAGNTLVKLGKEDISNIINTAAKSDPTFKRGVGGGDLEPQTFERLQCSYSTDERRALYDAAVSAAPSCSDLSELALPSIGEDGKEILKTKTRSEILAELRDMRRRRVKYRVATKSKNYSDVLRDVIKTQMEVYGEVIGEVETKPSVIDHSAQTDKQIHNERSDDNNFRRDEKDRHRTVFDRRDKNSVRCNEERNEKDNRSKDINGSKYNERRDRDYNNRNIREESKESQHHKRYNADHRTRDKSVTKVHTERNRDRSEVRQERDRGYKERGTEERRDRDHRYKDRGTEEIQNRDHRYKERTTEERRYKEHSYKERRTERHGDRQRQYREHKERDHDRSTERIKLEKEDSDTERARKLITEIKSEIDSVDQADNKDKLTLEMNHRKRDRVYDVGGKRHRRDDSGHRHSGDPQSDRSKEDRKRHRDSSTGDSKVYKEEHSRYKDSYRERSYERETKRSRVAEKHKTYYEIYAELDKRRNK